MLTAICIALVIAAVAGLVQAVRDGWVTDDDDVILRLSIELRVEDQAHVDGGAQYSASGSHVARDGAATSSAIKASCRPTKGATPR